MTITVCSEANRFSKKNGIFLCLLANLLSFWLSRRELHSCILCPICCDNCEYPSLGPHYAQQTYILSKG